MIGKFVRRRFSDIDLEDAFFDQLREDYPGSPTSRGFVEWFNNKAFQGEEALVYEDDSGVGAFVYLKAEETESIALKDGRILPPITRSKIGTMKIAERFQNRRIGEGALGLVLWQWRDSGIDEIYTTVFEKQQTLINLLTSYGFKYVGDNLNDEGVYIRNKHDIDFSDPCRAFPFLPDSMDRAGFITIQMDYHDTMFAFSDVARDLQKRVDKSVTNGLKKVYIGSPLGLPFKPGDPVFIYRIYTGDKGKKGFKSCITSYCVVTEIREVKKKGKTLMPYEEYRRIIGNKSVFTEDELINKYNELDNITLIEFLYYGYFGAGHNVNWVWLQNNGCWKDGHPYSFMLNRDQIDLIMKAGGVNVANVIVDQA